MKTSSVSGGCVDSRARFVPLYEAIKQKRLHDSGAVHVSGGEEAAFMAGERPRLAAQGITDFAAPTTELKRSLASIKKSKTATTYTAVSAAPTAGMTKLPAALDAARDGSASAEGAAAACLGALPSVPSDDEDPSYVRSFSPADLDAAAAFLAT